MTLTEYVLKILPQPQVAAAMVRSVGGVVTSIAGGAALLYLQFDEPFLDAVKYAAGFSVFPFLARNTEGLFDWVRASKGNVQKWDVAAYEEPLRK